MYLLGISSETSPEEEMPETRSESNSGEGTSTPSSSQFQNLSASDFVFSPRSNHSSGSDSEVEEENNPRYPLVNAQENKWRTEAKDYERVFNGHCNTTTDIKEAVFIGK